MTTLRIMSWNIERLEKHIPIIEKLLNDNDIDIAGFQEIQCLQTVEDTLNNATPGYHTWISTEDQSRDAIKRLKCANQKTRLWHEYHLQEKEREKSRYHKTKELQHQSWEVVDSTVIGFGDLNIRPDLIRPRNKKLIEMLKIATIH